MRLFVLLILALSPLLTSCRPINRVPKSSTSQTTLDFGRHKFPITTKSSAAQAAFNRGLTLAYAFSYLAAENEFRKAAELDPTAAMPWWGVALVNGPHINFPLVPEKNASVAWDALNRATALSSSASQLEKDLIFSLSKRYVEKQPKDRSELDRGYAAEMKRLWGTYPKNADVGTLYAESQMDLHPWDMWNSQGVLRPWTPEIMTVLEEVIKLNRKHPGAHHLYIHVVEASPTPEIGVFSADTLSDLVPAAGHLVHMPAHIYLRVGRLEDAAQSNINAIKADVEYRKVNPSPGFYTIYMLHNHHFLAFARMMQGKQADSLNAIREMLQIVTEPFLKEWGPIADGFMATPFEVLMRFGQWEAVLREPMPSKEFYFANAMAHFARASSLNALERIHDLAKERKAFHTAIKTVPKDRTFGNNSALALLKVAELVLDGEIDAKNQLFDSAIRNLKKAVELEDDLKYDEPPDWIIPVRHSLGQVYLRAGKYSEAEKVYKEDLKKFPKNIWSLFGLMRALELGDKKEEANLIRKDFEKVQKEGDTQLTGSCLCMGGI